MTKIFNIQLDSADNGKMFFDFNQYGLSDEIELQLGDYEIEVREGKTYAVKKKVVYPVSYEECCEFLGLQKLQKPNATGCYGYFFKALQRIIVCRDAYWKMSGYLTGLDDFWKPDWSDDNDKFIISLLKDKLYLSITKECNRILAFPTEEMRDIFFENFKEDIEICKNLI